MNNSVNIDATVVLRSVNPSIYQSADLSDPNSVWMIWMNFGQITDDLIDDLDDLLIHLYIQICNAS
jgi:hypothetical protein